MKTFTKLLTSLCLTCSVVSSSVFAGLITEKLDDTSTFNESGFNIYEPDTNPIITSNSVIRSTDSADISWLVDISQLVSIDFNMKLFGNYGLVSLLLGNALLWSTDTSTTTLTAISIDLADVDFDLFDSTMQSLSFGIKAANFDSSYIRVGRDDKVSFQLSNIRLTRTEVPEPSTVALLVLALAFVARRQLAQ